MGDKESEDFDAVFKAIQLIGDRAGKSAKASTDGKCPSCGYTCHCGCASN